MNNNKCIQLIVQVIRERREALHYSQEYMAFKMEIGQNCYSKIELGHNKLTVERLLQICDLLDLDTHDILQPQSLIRATG